MLAGYRVYPYLNNSRGGSISNESRQQLNAISDVVVPEYDQHFSAADTELLGSRLDRKVKAAFSKLGTKNQAGSRAVSSIASAYTKFVQVNFAGSLEDRLQLYAELSRDPWPTLVQEDPLRAQKAWLFSSAWARHAELSIESISVVPRYIQGHPVGEQEGQGVTVSPRQFRSGGWFHIDGPKGHTVYEIQMNVTVPSLDAKSEFEVVLGVSLVNDGLNGGWDVLETRFLGLKKGEFTTRPCP